MNGPKAPRDPSTGKRDWEYNPSKDRSYDSDEEDDDDDFEGDDDSHEEYDWD